MKTLNKLKEEYREIKRTLEEKQEEINNNLRKTVVLCVNSNHGKGCGKGFYIKDLVYIQTHRYETPYGCTGGDMWHRGEGNFDCPDCGRRNRLYNRKDIEELQHLFKTTIDEYER